MNKPMKLSRLGALSAVALALVPLSVTAQTPQVFTACYMRGTGLVYRIRAPGAMNNCLGGATLFTWTDGAGALRDGTPAGGDLGGTYANPTVARLQGTPVSPRAPTAGQVLLYSTDSSRWLPATPPSGVSVHSQLSGLDADDHKQYLLGNGTRSVNSGFAVLWNGTAGAIPASGMGDRLMWWASRRAFRAGQVVLGNEWDDANVGQASAAMGQGTIASGVASTALGGATTASGSASTSLGVRTIASGEYSLAAGQLTEASGNTSIALGLQARASGGAALATGLNTQASGDGAAAFGALTIASGTQSLATGNSTTASAAYATAMGGGSVASGMVATAMGRSTASGNYATSMGVATVASGGQSTAMGDNTTASGYRSTAMGAYASTNGFEGSFVYGDNMGGGSIVAADRANEFVVRASGGFRFRTSYDLSTGCDLPAGSGDWSCTSSRLLKTDFQPLDGESVLSGIRQLPVELWSYKSEPGVRHLGTFAEDLHRAFGLGIDSTSIGAIDMDGVNLAAVQALEQRTRELREQLAARDRAIAELQQRLARLEALLGQR